LAIAAGLFLCASAFSPTDANAVTKWWKIPPSACAIDVDRVANVNVVNDSPYGNVQIYSANPASPIILSCPLFLPDGVTANKLRIRTFQAGGLPAYANIYAHIYRLRWNSSTSLLAQAAMETTGITAADSADFSSVINNEEYQYQIYIAIYGTGTTLPLLSMIEVRYEE
jgi:hypothetical protein